MKSSIGYTEEFVWWHDVNVNNIVRAIQFINQGTTTNASAAAVPRHVRMVGMHGERVEL